MQRLSRITRIACLALVALTPIFAAAALALAASASDSDSDAGGARPAAACAKTVIVDWANDGVVEGRYRPTCLTEAIRRLPEDLRAYSNAEQDIDDALQRSLLQRTSSS